MRVPVLSKTIVWSCLVFSKISPPLINKPRSAPIPVPTKMAVGVAKPKAQGQAITKTAIANFRLNKVGVVVMGSGISAIA